jgi:hypothetical protein
MPATSTRPHPWGDLVHIRRDDLALAGDTIHAIGNEPISFGLVLTATIILVVAPGDRDVGASPDRMMPIRQKGC